MNRGDNQNLLDNQTTKPKLPILFNILTLLLLIDGVFTILGSFPALLIGGILAGGIFIIIGIGKIIVAIGFRKMKNWALYGLTTIVILMIIPFFKNQKDLITILTRVYEIIILVYFWYIFKKRVPKIWILAILIAFLAGGIFAWQYFGVPKEKVKMPAAEEQKVTTETAGWQTYTNYEYGFEFKYPENWSAIESTSPNYPYLVSVDLGPKETIQQGGLFGLILRDQNKDEFFSLLAQEKFYIISQLETALGDKQATFYILGRTDSPSIEWKEVITQKDGFLLEFSKGAAPGYDDIFNQMLSTFKFIEVVEKEKPSIKVLSPNGEEKIEVGRRSYTITWKISNVADLKDYFIMPYLKKGNIVLGPISNKSISTDALGYNWDWIGIPNYFDNGNLKTAAAGNDYKIKLELNKSGPVKISEDESDDYFSIVSLDETANWQVYKDEEYNFEIKYPRELTEIETTSPEEPIGGIIITISPHGWYKFYARKTFWGQADLCLHAPSDPLPISQTEKTIGGVLFTRRETKWLVNELPQQILVDYCGKQGDIYYFLQYVQTIREITNPLSFEEPVLGEALVAGDQLQKKTAQFEEIASTFRSLK